MRAQAPWATPTRRQMLAAFGCSVLVAGTGAGRADSTSVAGGTVFHDRDGSGRRRWSDPGIPGVMVSNGRDVVTTNEDGRWHLPVREGDSVFVIKPPHWTTPLDGCVPRFSRQYLPGATPAQIEAGAIGPNAMSVDFPLRESSEPPQFEALLFADTQPANSTELGFLRDDIIAAADQRAAFGINHGDVVFDAHGLYPEYLRLLGASGTPWHHCPGNHDIDYGALHDRDSRETWRRVFGARHYAFQYAGATFILLDNVYYFGCTTGAPGGYCGRIGPEQLQFVGNVLAHVPRDMLVVLSMHIPLVTYQAPGSAADTTADRRALLEVLSGHPHCVSFSGHMHSTEHHYLDADQGFAAPHPHHHHVLTAASGGWWGGPKDERGIPTAESPDGNPNGFHVLSIDGRHYETRFVPALAKTGAQMRLLLEGPNARRANGRFTADAGGGCVLVANVFDGGPRTRVTYALADVADGVQPMSRVVVTDPFVASKPWAHPVPSSHMWKAALPADLAHGTHRVTIRATDEYGRSHTAGMLLDITGG